MRRTKRFRRSDKLTADPSPSEYLGDSSFGSDKTVSQRVGLGGGGVVVVFAVGLRAHYLQPAILSAQPQEKKKKIRAAQQVTPLPRKSDPPFGRTRIYIIIASP